MKRKKLFIIIAFVLLVILFDIGCYIVAEDLRMNRELREKYHASLMQNMTHNYTELIN